MVRDGVPRFSPLSPLKGAFVLQQFLERHKKHIIRAVTLVLVIVAVAASWKNINATLLESAIGVVVTPFQDLTTGISSWVNTSITSAREKRDLKTENEELKTQIADLLAENKRLSLYDEENKRLSALLDIAQRYPELESTGTSVIAKDPGVWYDVFTIDKGTNDQMTANMVLIAPEGLVGKVLESGLTYSSAQSILDSRSSVPAMSLRTGDLGVVKGSYTLLNEGLCTMEYIDAEAEIMVGDEIVTSHLSDIYPAGIPIDYTASDVCHPRRLAQYRADHRRFLRTPARQPGRRVRWHWRGAFAGYFFQRHARRVCPAICCACRTVRAQPA